MSESHLRRLASTSGIYAAAALAQRGLAFILLPVYTRFIDPAEYGSLELLTAFSSITFGLLVFGLPSAVLKCYHRDADDPEAQQRVLATAIALATPVLVVGIGCLLIWAPGVESLLLGAGASGELLRIVALTGLFTSLIGLVLSNLRAEERAIAYSVVVLTQFLIAIGLNCTLVIVYSLGVRGVLWGNLISNVLALPLALMLAKKGVRFSIDRRLLRPLVRFGLYLVPVMISGFVIDLSDRYVLRLFTDLEEVAVYGVGYKFGMIVQLAVVWPFQLAWPAFAFSISNEEGHKKTYSRTLTYLAAALVFIILGLTLATRVGLELIAGPNYALAYRVVPLVALAYALNGVQYCVSPPVHVAEKSRYLSFLAMLGAALNLGLNFLFIPALGQIGAAITTSISFFAIAVGTIFLAERFYKVHYELKRVFLAVFLGVFILAVAFFLPTSPSVANVALHVLLALFAYPVLLFGTRFFKEDERRLMTSWLARARSLLRPRSV